MLNWKWKSWIQAELIVREIENEATFNEYLEKFPVIGEWKKRSPYTHSQKLIFKYNQPILIHKPLIYLIRFVQDNLLWLHTYTRFLIYFFFLYVGRKSPQLFRLQKEKNKLFFWVSHWPKGKEVSKQTRKFKKVMFYPNVTSLL